MQSAICNLQSAVCKCQTLEMLWEHEPQASVSTAFSGSPKVSRVLILISIGTRKTPRRKKGKKEKNLLLLNIKM